MWMPSKYLLLMSASLLALPTINAHAKKADAMSLIANARVARVDACKKAVYAKYTEALSAKADFEKSCKALDLVRQVTCIGVHMEELGNYHSFKEDKYYPDHTINLSQLYNSDLKLITEENSDFNCQDPSTFNIYNDITAYYKQRTTKQALTASSAAQSASKLAKKAPLVNGAPSKTNISIVGNAR